MPATSPVNLESFIRSILIEHQAVREADFDESILEPSDQLRLGIIVGPLKVTSISEATPVRPAAIEATPLDPASFSTGKFNPGSTLIQIPINCDPSAIDPALKWKIGPDGATCQPKGPIPPSIQIGTTFFLRDPSIDYLRNLPKLLRDSIPPLTGTPATITWPHSNEDGQHALPRLLVSTPNASPSTARERALAACLNDFNPLLMVKGPPGTGKTHLLAEVAGTLAKNNITVMICAVAHAAVDNALSAINSAFPDIETYKYGRQDKQTIVKPRVPFGIVIAAAQYRLKKDPVADVLLLDEAGQIPAFYAAALSRLARRTILFGDESQLPCILQGQHLPHTFGGSSAMDYLKAVLPPDYLLPLDRSHRMNRDICALIQRHFYPDIPSLQPADSANADARLISTDGNNNLPSLRQIRLTHARPCLTHSPEEVQAVLDYVRTLLTDYQLTACPLGTRPLAPADIAILTPYRQQTQALRKALDADPRLKDIKLVGTVDKMQGQGAPVLIYSLATSSPDHIAAQAEWLFSSNRWNVALSRAMAHTAIIGDIQAHLSATPSTIPGWNAQRKIREVLEDQGWEGDEF